jgi:hypothetical protein
MVIFSIFFIVFGIRPGFPAQGIGCSSLLTAGCSPLTNLGPEKIFGEGLG